MRSGALLLAAALVVTSAAHSKLLVAQGSEEEGMDAIPAENNATSSSSRIWKNKSEAQAALRAHLLENYDRGSMPPFVPTPENNGSEYAPPFLSAPRQSSADTAPFPFLPPALKKKKGEYAPTTIEVGINFHRILEVDVVRSEVDLLTWMRFIWNDTRLSWDPEEYAGIDKLWFWIESGAGMSETSEIWTPDIELWNQMESIQTSYANTFAAVDPSGGIFWSRPGHLKPVCKFVGLERFPFDNLECVIELGSWGHSGKFLRLEPFDGTGFSIGGSDTSGESFSEFTLDTISAELVIYPPYPSDPLADWPVIMYSISFHRSWQPYIRGYLISQIIFNIIGFACFWLPIQSGERLGLSITAMLSAVAADLVVVSKLPSASELTWMQKFSMLSQAFAGYCVLEGVIVSYFYFQVSNNLVPNYLQCIFARMPKLGRSPSGEPLGASSDSRLDILTNPLGNSGESRDGSNPSNGESYGRRPSFRGPRDADDFRTRQEQKNNAGWQRVASHIDSFSQLVVVPLYLAIVCVFLVQVTEHHESAA